MDYIKLVSNAKKKFVQAIIFSIVAIFICYAGIRTYTRNKPKDEINTIEKTIFGCTFETFITHNELFGSYNEITSRIKFTDSSSGIYKTYEYGSPKESSFRYTVEYSSLGTPVVWMIGLELPYSDYFFLKDTQYPIYFDDIGVAKIGDYVMGGRELSGSLSRKVSKSEILFYVVLTTCCLFVVVRLMQYIGAILDKSDIERKEKEKIDVEIKKEEEKRQAEIVKRRDQQIAIINSYWKDYASKYYFIPSNAIDTNNQWLWTDNKNLHLMETETEYLKKYDIKQEIINTSKVPVVHSFFPLESIQYFTKEGDVQYTTKVYGGGGGGYSLAGAIVGGLVAGDTGAIIGSRKKVNDVVSKTETHDNRHTLIRYYEGSSIKTLSFNGFAVYDYLLNKIPDKDLLTIQLKNNTPQFTDNSNIKEKLVNLKSLLDEGLISEDEYKAAKAALLEKL